MTTPMPGGRRERVPHARNCWTRRTRLVLATCLVLAAVGLAGREWALLTARGQQPALATAGATDAAAARRTLTVGFKWDPNTDSDVAGYVVSWGDRPGRYTNRRTLGPESTSVELELERRREPYFVVVQARNAHGEISGYSNEFSLDVSSGRARAARAAKKAGQKPKREKPPKQKKQNKKQKAPSTPP